MEITLDSIIGILGLLFGGGAVGGIFTWRWQREKTKAEAKQAEVEVKEKEAEAKAKEIEIAQKVQDTYQQMLDDKQKEVDDNHRLITELREDRDHYKCKADELSEKFDKLTHNVAEWKNDSDERIRTLQAQVARNGRQLEAIRPFMCGNLQCKDRQRVVLAEDGTLKTKRPSRKEKQSDIEPINAEDL